MKSVTSKTKHEYSKIVNAMGPIHEKHYAFRNVDRKLKFLKTMKIYKKYFESYENLQFDFSQTNRTDIVIKQTTVGDKQPKANKIDYFKWLEMYKNLITKINKFSDSECVSLQDMNGENFKMYNNEMIVIDENKVNLHANLNCAKNECIYGAYAYLCANPDRYRNLSPYYTNKKILDTIEEAFYGI